MKKNSRFLSLVFAFLCCVPKGYGQTTIDAELRPRTEFRQGFRKPLADVLTPGFLTIQRTRLNADYKGKILNTRIALQDARIWVTVTIKPIPPSWRFTKPGLNIL